MPDEKDRPHAPPEQPKHSEQPIRDDTHGHPGLPPKDYKQPPEKKEE